MPDDTNKVFAYLRSFRATIFENKDTAIIFAQRATLLSEKLNFAQGQADGYRFQGVFYMMNDASELALEKYQKGFDIQKRLPNKINLVKLMNGFGTVYMELEQYDSALHYLSSALEVFTDPAAIPDSALIATVKHNMGICLDYSKRHQEAYTVFESNLAVFEALGFDYETSYTYGSLGNVSLKLEQPDLALSHLHKAEALKLKLNDKRGLAITYENIGRTWLKKDQRDSAIFYNLRSIEIAKDIEDARVLASGKMSLSSTYAKSRKFESAYIELQEAKEILDSLNVVDKADQIIKMQTAYGMRQKDEEINQLQLLGIEDRANINFQRLLIGGLIGIIILAFIFLLLLIRSSKAKTLLNQRLQLILKENENQNQQITSKNVALSETNAALEQANHEQNAIIHMIIHDLKSPVSGAAALIDLLGTNKQVLEDGIPILGKIEAANQRALDLISDLLAVYQSEHLYSNEELSNHNVSQFVDSVFAPLQGHADKKGIQVHIDVPSSSPQVKISPSYLTRVLENLFSNALKFSQPGKEIWISARVKDKWLAFEIKDQGPGISLEDQKKLFQKFTRLSARPTAGENSSGLGLAIVKNLTDAMGGEIQVESTLNAGTTFRVRIPC